VLYNAKLTGIHRRSDVLKYDTVGPIIATPSIHLMYHSQEAWIAAESSTEADKIDPFHSDGSKERVEKYILQGGTDPMTGHNIWCDEYEVVENYR
jgi:hypothetical protein